MDKLRIPVWLLALAFIVITGLIVYSIVAGKPIYIHGQAWGTSEMSTNVDLKSVKKTLEALSARKPRIRCQIVFRGKPNPGDRDSLGNTEYNTTCPSGYDHIMNSRIYSMGKEEQWQSLCCQVYYEQ